MKKQLTTVITLTKKDLEDVLRSKLGLTPETTFAFNVTADYSGYRDDVIGYTFKSVDITSTKEVEL